MVDVVHKKWIRMNGNEIYGNIMNCLAGHGAIDKHHNSVVKPSSQIKPELVHSTYTDNLSPVKSELFNFEWDIINCEVISA
jgi:hypothetical protein